jgi:phage FluMu protein Com
MPISLDCLGCGKKLWVKDESAGARVRCPACKSVMNIPDPEEPEQRQTTAQEGEGRPRPRRKRRQTQQATQKIFDAMERRPEPPLVDALDGVLRLNVFLLILGAVLIAPIALIVVLISNDKEATRNAGLVLFISFIQAFLLAWVFLLLKSLDTPY